MEPERRRLALHAGRGARLRVHGAGWQMAGEFAGPAARPEPRLDQHGPGDQGQPARRPRYRPAEALHRGGPLGRCRCRTGRDRAGTPDLSRPGLPGSLPYRSLAFRRDCWRCASPAGRHHRTSDSAGRSAAARGLRSATHGHGAAIHSRSSGAPAAGTRMDRRGCRGKDRGIRAGTRGQDSNVAGSRRRRQ